MSATARSTATRPVTPRATRAPHSSARRRPTLREVPPPAAKVAGSGVFAVIVVALLLGGMVSLLVLNTTLAQGAFEIGSLTKVSRDLAVNEQKLLQKVAHAESPESLQSRADDLGMVPATAPVFLRLADRAVLGSPSPAVAKPVAAAAAKAPKKPTTGTTATSGTTPAVAGPVDAGDTSDEAVPDPPTAESDAAVADQSPTP